MTAQEWYGSLPPEQQEAIWRAGISVEEAFQRATDGSAGGPGMDMGPDPQRMPAGAPETPPGSPIASSVASRPVRRPSLPYEPQDQVSEEDMPSMPAGPAGDPMAGLQQPKSRGRTFLRTLAQPFSGDEGKLRLMQLLGELGQGYLGSRGAAKANRQTRESQALANVVNAVGRSKPGARGAQYEATPGIGQTLLAGLAGAGRMGQEAIATNRTRGQEDWKQGMEEAAAGRQEREVGLAEQRAGYEGQRLEQDQSQFDAGQELEREKMALEARLAGARDATERAGIAARLKQIDATLAAAKIRADAAGKKSNLPSWVQQRMADAQNSLGLVQKARELRGKAGIKGFPGATSIVDLFGRFIDEEGRTYQNMRKAVGLPLAAAFNKGRPTQADAEAVLSALGELSEDNDVAEQQFTAMEDLLQRSYELLANGQAWSLPASSYIRPDGTLDEELMANTVVPVDTGEAVTPDQQSGVEYDDDELAE